MCIGWAPSRSWPLTLLINPVRHLAFGYSWSTNTRWKWIVNSKSNLIQRNSKIVKQSSPASEHLKNNSYAGIQDCSLAINAPTPLEGGGEDLGLVVFGQEN